MPAAGIEGAEIYAEGFDGGEVSFLCPHRFAWKYDKYFCRYPCKSSEDKLATVHSGGRTKAGRITLVDSGDGAFTVTFSQLQLSDLGTYYCAADRPGLDTFTEVLVTVKEGTCITINLNNMYFTRFTFMFVSGFMNTHFLISG